MSDSPDPAQKFSRSQSAISGGYRRDARSRYNEYLKQLEEKTQLSKAYNSEQKSKDDLLKQRENGFKLYINGVHHVPPPRSSSATRRRNDSSFRRTQTPAPSHTTINRRRWMPPIQTKIKTDHGSVTTDIHHQIMNSNHRSKQSVNNQLTYRLVSSPSVDQSWMPDWFWNMTSNAGEQNPDVKQSLSLSFDNISTVGLTSSQQRTYRLSIPVGARLAGGDLTKNASSTHATNQPLFVTGTRRTSKTVDSLDLENVLHPKEVHIDSEVEEKKSSQASNKRSPFAEATFNDRQTDRLEKSITQLELFSRKHRGTLENEKIEEYFSSGSPKTENDNDEEQFTIPELPVGEQLVFNLKTTWGDRHYVGLNGIELFSGEGHPILIKKIAADPPDINILPEYGNDPRVVTNLVDGVNKTRDDIHMWLAPFTSGRPHFICITFEHPTKIAMIRIWNYNKNRIHSARGARDVEIALDGRVIFKGEITQACGNINASNDPSAYGETILFTTDEKILESISNYDEMYIDQEAAQDDDENMKTAANRPPSPGTDVRPMTRAMLRRPFTAMRSSAASQVPEYYGKKLILTVTETWGDPDYCGLTGLEVVDVNDADCVIQSFDARPRDVTVLSTHENAVQRLENLFDSENVTCNPNHMWLCPFNRKERVRIMITLSVSKKLHGLRIWNYNESSDDTYRGIKRLHVQLNDKVISPRQGFLLRRAPGHCFFDFVQEIVFAHAKTMIPEQQKQARQAAASVQNADSDISMPNGFIFEFQFHSTHGDAYYVGLNGIEFYDDNGECIGLTQQNIAAYPHSVNALNPGTDDDVRTPDKLIDGENDDVNGSHSWIAPILPNIINRVFVIFDRPTSVSMIKIWNYAKTPSRGVREFSLLVDDLLVWTGILDKMNDDDDGKVYKVPFNTILFADERILTEHEKQTVLENKNTFDNVSSPPASRDQTVDYSKRPTTSLPRAHRKPSNK
ncbi:unnamed protein product [Adineta ricciae]|uniref:KATNIP domain-containing protein n=3 Tax=Adineta ricciae TaxID=249248 RepID=A0A814KGD1_ADIRI|nr:unnamed protein product [Adineta ricciae]